MGYGNFGGGGGYGGGRGSQDFRRPVDVGDELDVKIEAVGAKGDGIARKDGFVLFVPGVREGDEVHIKVTKVLRKVGFAEVVGSASAPVRAAAPAREAPAEAMPAPEPEPHPEDSEDFGEEPEDLPAPEAPDADEFEEDLEPAPEPTDEELGDLDEETKEE